MDAIKYPGLDIPKRRLAIVLKDLGDGHTRGIFDDGVGVEEVVCAYATGEGFSDGGFPGAHHSDEVEVAAVEAG